MSLLPMFYLVFLQKMKIMQSNLLNFISIQFKKRKTRNFFIKFGRKRKKFNDLKGNANILKRRKEMDTKFHEKHSISINQYVMSQNLKFLPSLPNYLEIRKYISDKNNGTIILNKIPIETVMLSKDKAIISYKKLTILRKTLHKYLPSTDTILKRVKLINRKICDRDQIEIKRDCIVLNNIELFI